jgi:hypothetical protein
VDATNRPVIAYIVGSLVTGARCWVMQDHGRDRSVCLDGVFTGGGIKVYSYELDGYVSGHGAEGRYVLFQHRSAKSLNLSINSDERTFSGWDHGTSRYFLGNVAERTVRLFDYQDLQWHAYTLTC